MDERDKQLTLIANASRSLFQLRVAHLVNSAWDPHGDDGANRSIGVPRYRVVPSLTAVNDERISVAYAQPLPAADG